MWSTLVLLQLVLYAAFANARSAFGDSVLVVLPSLSSQHQDTYSQFWESLKARGFHLTFRTPESGPALFEYDAPSYDHLILLAPTAKSFSSDLAPSALFDFMNRDDKPRNILVGLSQNASEAQLSFAREFSLEFDVRTSSLIDHTLFVPSLDDGSHTTVRVPWQASTKRVLYKGLAHGITPYFPLAINFLHGTPTSYSYDPRKTVESELDGSMGPALSGKQASLVTGVQTLKSSRIVWSGSVDLFSDAFNTPDSANEELVQHVTRWCFQEQGVLRIDSVAHSRVGEHVARKEYRIRDDMTYAISISEYKQDQWQPSNIQDLQFDLRMLDTFIRTDLVPSALPISAHEADHGSSSTTYTASMTLPDKHGVFTLLTEYKRPGYTFLESRQTVSIVPPRHDEWPRFISSAWPWYLSAMSTSTGFLVFVAIWLAIDLKKEGKGKGKAE